MIDLCRNKMLGHLALVLGMTPGDYTGFILVALAVIKPVSQLSFFFLLSSAALLPFIGIDAKSSPY